MFGLLLYLHLHREHLSVHPTAPAQQTQPVMVPKVDEADNLARMQRGELYYAFTPKLTADRRRCGQAVGRFNRAGDLTRREIAQHWKE